MEWFCHIIHLCLYGDKCEVKLSRAAVEGSDNYVKFMQQRNRNVSGHGVILQPSLSCISFSVQMIQCWHIFSATQGKRCACALALIQGTSCHMSLRIILCLNPTMSISATGALPASRHGPITFITFCHFFLTSLCSLGVITAGHFAAAVSFNESFRCLVDNRVNECLSALAAATALAYQIINFLQIDCADIQTEAACPIRITYLRSLSCFYFSPDIGGKTNKANSNFILLALLFWFFFPETVAHDLSSDTNKPGKMKMTSY